MRVLAERMWREAIASRNVVGSDQGQRRRRVLRDLAGLVGAGSINPHGPEAPVDGVCQVADAREGDTSLRWSHNGPDWGGVYFLFGPYDPTRHEKLVIYLRLPEEVTSLEVKIEGPATKGQSVELVHYAAAAEGKWKTSAVPLVNLDKVNGSKLSIIGLWKPKNDSGGFVACDILVDGIRFE
jgi:hypothetical protein